MNNLDTKPLVNPLNDITWLKRKISIWERAQKEAEGRLSEAEDMLAYYRQWLNEIDESEAGQ